MHSSAPLHFTTTEQYPVSCVTLVGYLIGGILALVATGILLIVAAEGGVVFFVAIPLCGLSGVAALLSIPIKAQEKLIVDNEGFQVRGCLADDNKRYSWTEVQEVGMNLRYSKGKIKNGPRKGKECKMRPTGTKSDGTINAILLRNGIMIDIEDYSHNGMTDRQFVDKLNGFVCATSVGNSSTVQNASYTPPMMQQIAPTANHGQPIMAHAVPNANAPPPMAAQQAPPVIAQQAPMPSIAPMRKAFCTSCGSELKGGQFCAECGARV